MRIFIIHAHYQHRGGEDVVVDHELSLLKSQHDVEVYFTQNEKGWKGAVQTALSPLNIWEASKILKKIKTFRPDVVHIHNTHYSIGPYIISAIKKANFPIVVTLHNYRLLCPSAILAHNNQIYLKSLSEDFPWSAVKDRVHGHSYIKTFWLALTYWLHKKWGTWLLVDQFLVFSEFAKNNFLKSKVGIPQNLFTIKPNSVREIPKVEQTCDGSFFYLGRLSEEKGIIPLLRGIVGTDIPLKIAGDGPQKQDVLEIIKNQKNIKYLGNLDKLQVYQELNSCTALVLPSVCYEGMPISVLEAFSQGVIAMTSDLGVFKNIIEEGKNGFRFDPNSPEDIQYKLKYWLHLDPNIQKKMQLQAKKDFLDKYTDEKNLSILNDTYQRVIANR